MNDDNSCLVSVDERGEQITADWSYEAQGQIWSLPLVDSTVNCLKEVYFYLNNPATPSKTKKRVEGSLQSIFPKLSLEHNGETMNARLIPIIQQMVEEINQ